MKELQLYVFLQKSSIVNGYGIWKKVLFYVHSEELFRMLFRVSEIFHFNNMQVSSIVSDTVRNLNL